MPSLSSARSDDDVSGAARTVVVLDCDLQDDVAVQGGPVDSEAQARRLQRTTDALREELAARGLYRVLDTAPASRLIADYKKSQQLSQCNGCEIEIAQALGGDRVMVCWVDKVSNLIINVNIGVSDVATGRKLFVRSADLRGNTDDSWLRAVRRLARQIEEGGLHRR